MDADHQIVWSGSTGWIMHPELGRGALLPERPYVVWAESGGRWPCPDRPLATRRRMQACWCGRHAVRGYRTCVLHHGQRGFRRQPRQPDLFAQEQAS